MVKVMGWYDNEWGYSCRTSDLCAFLAAKGAVAKTMPRGGRRARSVVAASYGGN